ncbi:MAG: A/G-specific adenine glycosylase [Clostridia bacterium]|nr:A/G-specific adenine glycosylase [Clostridia bacterium]
MELNKITSRIVEWHRSHKRDLPWRVDPSPYHTWLSEIMLQQTRIEAVIPYYHRFLQELPTIEALANVPEDRLLKLWEGLGYYSRARNLKKAAQKVMEEYGGQLPITAKELRALPGIGEYTAGAIASMSFGQPEPAVDGNVLRVITRITGDDGDITQTAVRKRITQSLREIYPSGVDAGDFTEGLMELGETVCIPAGVPRCQQCPVAEYCVANKENKTQQLPVKSEKKKRKIQHKIVFVLECNGKYAIRRRPDQGLLAGMWELPNVDKALCEEQWGEALGLSVVCAKSLEPSVHIFTHVEWHMDGVYCQCETCDPGYVWITPAEILHETALPVAFRVYKDWILKQL